MGALLTTALVLLSADRQVSFDEARAAARAAAPEVLLSHGRVAVAAAEIDVAGTLPNPTLTVGTALQTARLATTLSVPLPLFGQRGTAVRAAQADADAAVLDVRAVQRDAQWSVTLAWLDLWETQARAKLLESAAADAERLYQVAQEKYETGIGPQLDVVRTRADRARAAAELAAAQQLVTAAADRLAPLIGAPGTERLSAAGDPPAVVLPALEGLSVDAHPLVLRDRAQVVAAERHADAERRLRWPTVTPQVTVSQFDPTLPGTDVLFGVAIDVPVLNQRGGAIAKADASRSLAELTAQLDARRLAGELRNAYRRAEAANARLVALRDEVVPSMKTARAMTEEGFRSGRIDLLHLLDAQRVYLEAQLSHVEARAAASRALADLERASGGDRAQ